MCDATSPSSGIRGALGVQGVRRRRRAARARRQAQVAALVAGLAAGHGRPQGVAGTSRLTKTRCSCSRPRARSKAWAEGGAAAGLRDPHRRRPPLCGKNAAAVLPAALRRHRRGADVEPPSVVRRATGSHWSRPHARATRSRRGSRPEPQQAAAGAPEEAGPAGAEDCRLVAAGRRHPAGLPQGRHRAGGEQGGNRSTRLKVAESSPRPPMTSCNPAPVLRATTSSSRFGISVEGIDEVMLRMAKCCRRVPVIRSSATSPWAAGLRSTAEVVPMLRRRATCRHPGTAMLVPGRDPGRRVGIATLRNIARPGSTSSRCTVADRSIPTVKTASSSRSATTHALDQTINRLRNIESAFDAYRRGRLARAQRHLDRRQTGWRASSRRDRRSGAVRRPQARSASARAKPPCIGALRLPAAGPLRRAPSPRPWSDDRQRPCAKLPGPTRCTK